MSGFDLSTKEKDFLKKDLKNFAKEGELRRMILLEDDLLIILIRALVRARRIKSKIYKNGDSPKIHIAIHGVGKKEPRLMYSDSGASKSKIKHAMDKATVSYKKSSNDLAMSSHSLGQTPGGVPLYKKDKYGRSFLVGALAVSGDHPSIDEEIAIAASQDFAPPENIRSDKSLNIPFFSGEKRFDFDDVKRSDMDEDLRRDGLRRDDLDMRENLDMDENLEEDKNLRRDDELDEGLDDELEGDEEVKNSKISLLSPSKTVTPPPIENMVPPDSLRASGSVRCVDPSKGEGCAWVPVRSPGSPVFINTEDGKTPQLEVSSESIVDLPPLPTPNFPTGIPVVRKSPVKTVPSISTPSVGETSVPSVPSVGGTSVPSVPSVGGTSVPSVPSVGGTSIPSVGGTSVPSIPPSSVGGTSVPSIPPSSVGGTSVPSIPPSSVGGTSVPSIPSVGGTSVPSIPPSSVGGTSVPSIPPSSVGGTSVPSISVPSVGGTSVPSVSVPSIPVSTASAAPKPPSMPKMPASPRSSLTQLTSTKLPPSPPSPKLSFGGTSNPKFSSLSPLK